MRIKRRVISPNLRDINIIMTKPTDLQPELRSLAARLAMTEYADPKSEAYEKRLDALWFELEAAMNSAMTAVKTRNELAVKTLTLHAPHGNMTQDSRVKHATNRQIPSHQNIQRT
jgi:hypothetical protein